MAEKIRRVDYFYFTCDDRPGEGAKILGKLRDAKVNLLAFSAFPGSGGKSQITIVPEKADALQAAARGAGLTISPRKECFLVQGDDRVGAGYDVLKRLNDDYRPKAIYITENGAAFTDVVGPDGRIRDERRVAYLRDHFRVAQQAIQDGIPLRGYFVWSLLDNFEWAYGYGKRFGIIRVDFATGERRWKDSAHFYQAVIRANAMPE